MTNVLTTKLSSRGQVVLPESLRSLYGWEAGTSFTVFVYNGSVIMQPIKVPTEDELAREFEEVFDESRRQAKAAGMTPSDVSRALCEVRRVHRSKRMQG